MVDLKLKLPDGFLEEETRSGFIVSAEMKKVWAVELDLLGELDRVCRKLGLSYYADSGTLLGAVRHQGFIPWDDDIDVVMFREDYDKLVKTAANEFDHPYFFQTAYSDDGYYRGHAQLRNSETTNMLPEEALTRPFNQGIFLDIFPLDASEADPHERDKKLEALRRYRRMFRLLHSPDSPNPLKQAAKRMLRRSLLQYGPKRLYARFEDLCRQDNGAGEHVDKVSFYTRSEQYRLIPRSVFQQTVSLPFEFMTVPAPLEYDTLLRLYYGDSYMQPQRLSSDHQTGGALTTDPDTPYKETIRQLRERLER